LECSGTRRDRVTKLSNLGAARFFGSVWCDSSYDSEYRRRLARRRVTFSTPGTPSRINSAKSPAAQRPTDAALLWRTTSPLLALCAGRGTKWNLQRTADLFSQAIAIEEKHPAATNGQLDFATCG